MLQSHLVHKSVPVGTQSEHESPTQLLSLLLLWLRPGKDGEL